MRGVYCLLRSSCPTIAPATDLATYLYHGRHIGAGTIMTTRLRNAQRLACIGLPALLFACCAPAGAATAQAQAYPSKAIHIVVPFAPGGITDVIGRAFGARLTETLGQQVVIENKPGANSQVGAEYVARAAPDGHTLMVTADT